MEQRRTTLAGTSVITKPESSIPPLLLVGRQIPMALETLDRMMRVRITYNLQQHIFDPRQGILPQPGYVEPKVDERG